MYDPLAMYKANSRNAILLEEYLRVRGEALLKEQAEKEAEESRGTTAPAAPTSLPTESEQLLSATASGSKESGRSWSSLVPSIGKKQAATLARSDRGRFIEDVNN